MSAREKLIVLTLRCVKSLPVIKQLVFFNEAGIGDILDLPEIIEAKINHALALGFLPN